MMAHRTVRRATVLALAVLIAAIAVPVAAAKAHHGPPYTSGPENEFGEMVFYPMVFPVGGTNYFYDSFYSPRCCSSGEVHHATDIMSPKMTPILSPVNGTIRNVNWSWNPDNIDYSRCCTLAIDHNDGWSSWYIHINNDTPGTDDGRGALGPIVDGQINPAWGIAPGIEPGVEVVAGQLLGWVGDSGNAEGTGSHLHFELIDPYGVRVNPYQALLDAKNGLYEPCVEGDPVCRVAGRNRYHTAAMLSAENFPDGADIVFIATGAGYPDALAGGAVAARVGAPLLLVAPGVIPPETEEELERLEPDQIVILGGEAVVTAAVASQLEGYGSVIRLAGSNRYGTAAAISQFGFPNGTETVLIATGANFADALAGGPAAAYLEGVVLLTLPGSLPTETSDEVARLEPDNIIVIGGTTVISAQVEEALNALAPTTRVFGSDRYATAAALSEAVFPESVGSLYVAVGTNFPDAIAGGAAAGLNGSPLLVVPTNSLPASVSTEVERLNPGHITVLGGPNAVSANVMQALTALMD